MSRNGENHAHKKESRKRRQNYSREEKLVIVDFVKRRREDLFGKAGYCGVKVEDRKRKAWEELSVKLRSSGGKEVREWRDLKKKWQDMKSRAVKLQAKAHLTGGGPPTPIDFVSEKILETLPPEVTEGLSSSQNEAGLGECTNSQNSEDDPQMMTLGDEEMDVNTGNPDEVVVENLNAITEIVSCSPHLIHDDLIKISGQLSTIIELLKRHKEE
ncbi:uncharacterized protein [Diadema antillarum]|uniref:uncharacterized protein n=1 Tax=Diadema antillarum TaxID=105358 RepID=UPI003A8AA6BF